MSDITQIQREILMMVRQLEEMNVLIRYNRRGYDGKNFVTLTHNDQHYGDDATTHAYLSGALHVARMYDWDAPVVQEEVSDGTVHREG